MRVPNTNSQTIHQMGQAINAVVRQATGRDAVQNIDMDFVTVAQNKTVQVFSESVPYMFRRTGGGMNIGNARLSRNKVIGGTLAWNQLINKANISETVTRNGVTFTNNGDGTITVSGTATDFTTFTVKPAVTFASHKYILYGCPSGGSESSYNLRFRGQATDVLDTGNGCMWYSQTYLYKGIAICIENGTAISTPIVFKPQLFDLTQMFGSTIADYIYSLEQATAGAGVAWFHKYFHSFYDYNSGELMSVSGLVSHNMTGFNQWDEQWEVGSISGTTGEKIASSASIRSKNYIPVIPNTQYFCYCAYIIGKPARKIALYCYGADLTYIGPPTPVSINNGIFTTPNNCYYLMFRTGGNEYASTYQNDICFNFSDHNLNGKYEPYHLYSYPLDSDLILRGIPKLDTDNKLYYDGDVYEHDGKVTRKYGTVNLGSLEWGKQTLSNNRDAFYTNFSLWDDLPLINQSAPIGAINPILTRQTYMLTSSWGKDCFLFTSSQATLPATSFAMIFDSGKYADAESFKTAMSGVYLVYELGTPTTETADPFTDPQEVSPFGTEEYISTGIVPVGNETQYLELSDTNM